MSYTKTDSDFISNGTRCAGWLYLPEGVLEPPIVIMAHGLAAERTFRLPAYAERFLEKGMSIFLFDYRNFGDSDGLPRNLVNPFRHIQDWKAAIYHVRTLKGINTNKIGLWGTSFSGGHVIVTAASDPKIAAIVSQVPWMDGISSALMVDWKYTITAMVSAFRDILKTIALREPYYVPVVGEPDTFAVMNSPDCKPGYMALVPRGSSWKNECPARIFIYLLIYRPLSFAERVKCPALLIMAEKDFGISPKAVEKCADRMSNATLIRLPVGHFEPYVGDLFEQTVEKQTNFLKEHLF
ncbi:MAG: alpha/beta hydrolase [Deltaproteobacteria bacterium]|nr:alpha/beta hydrolase [Deltaproteobacteria bacterium]